MKPSASLFTGGGSFDIGALQAGFTPVWGVEIDPKIAEYAERNIKDFRVIVSDVATVDYSILPHVNHLHLSPVCKNASVANSQAGEAPEDIEAAKASCRAIETLQPETVTLENVWPYRDFEAFRLIVRCLRENGYRLDWWHLNAADYGVPQTRKRLILIADKRRQPQRPQPTHSETPDMFGVYKPWIGWHEAIEDLIPDLPESQFAPWQLKRLPNELRTMTVSNQGYGDSITFSEVNEPIFTIVSSSKSTYSYKLLVMTGNTNLQEAKPGKGCLDINQPANTVMVGMDRLSVKAFVVGSQYAKSNSSTDRPPQTRLGNEPYFTVTVSGVKHNDQRIFFGRVVKPTPRTLARFQSFPDWYELPSANDLTGTIIGNAVPCLLAQRIMESVG